MGHSGARIVSLDLPSGVDADSGDTPGVFLSAEATLTLHLPKPGLASPTAGALWVADLGIPAEVTRRVGIEPRGYGLDFVAPLERG
jgi:NAD(P)H-hydrate epimerase